jgi:hypothetical protein
MPFIHSWNRSRMGLPLVVAVAALVAAACGGSTPAPSASTPEPLPSPTVMIPTDSPTADPTSNNNTVFLGDIGYSGMGTSSTERVEVGANLTQIYKLLANDAIAPIYDPQFVRASDADSQEGNFVIGLKIDGDARAYPLSVLVSREMVNDVVGGVPVLVTW